MATGETVFLINTHCLDVVWLDIAPKSSYTPNLYLSNQTFPVEHIRRADDNLLYVVYAVDAAAFSDKDAIDPIAGLYRRDTDFTGKPVLTFNYYHYPTDGIICVTFARDKAESEFAVSDISYDASFGVPDPRVEGVLTLKTAPEDYRG